MSILFSKSFSLIALSKASAEIAAFELSSIWDFTSCLTSSSLSVFNSLYWFRICCSISVKSLYADALLIFSIVSSISLVKLLSFSYCSTRFLKLASISSEDVVVTSYLPGPDEGEPDILF